MNEQYACWLNCCLTEWMKENMNEWMNERTNERMRKRTDEWMNERTNERKEGRTDEHTKEIKKNCLRWFFGLYSGYTITYFSNSLTVLMLLKKDGSHRKPKGNKIIQFTKQTQPGNCFSRGHLVGQSFVRKASIFFYFEATILRSRKKSQRCPLQQRK